MAVGVAITASSWSSTPWRPTRSAKLDFPGKSGHCRRPALAVAIPVAALVIPLFFLVRWLGLLDTYWALILPPLANPLGIFMIRSFMVSIPDDLVHSARLDGASEFGISARSSCR